MSTDQQRPATEAEKTPLFIGAGVQFTGSIRHAGPQDERAVVLGEFTGDVEWNGVLHVPRGGKLVVEKSLRCREMLVCGEIVGANEDAVIATGLLRLGKTATIEVGVVSVPPGGLEQQRGSVVNAKLRMTKENAYADQQAPAAAAATSPSLTLVSSGGAVAASLEESSEQAGATELPRFLTAHRGA
jgi:cytoskeletal protein CcmA (bactofilin family)